MMGILSEYIVSFTQSSCVNSSLFELFDRISDSRSFFSSLCIKRSMKVKRWMDKSK